MRIQAVILAALAGCNADEPGSCRSPDREFSLEAPLLESEISTLFAETEDDLCAHAVRTDRSEITCEDVCHLAHRDANDNICQVQIQEVRDCEFTLAAEPGATPETEVGSVTCAGIENPNGCVGRRPLGHVELAVSGDDLAAYLVRNAHLEAAAVVAFEQLADLLGSWSAPPALVLRCLRAAREEAFHAELLAALAREIGAAVPPVQQQPHARDLGSVALHNAVEGCVREAWAALCAARIAGAARTPRLREVFARLAADEARHAQLAWDLHTWFMGQVSPTQRERLIDAQRAAMAGLAAVARDEAATTPAILGLPGAGAITRLSHRFVAGLAAAA